MRDFIKDTGTAIMTGAGLSLEAIGWVLRDAPGVPAQCVSVLIGLAEHADKRGRGAYPSAATLAAYARKSERQVRYDLKMLTELKLIRPGNQSEPTRKYPPNRRPVAYDLALELCASKPSDCVYCGDPADTTDHVIPVSRGGTDLPANRVPACGRCNSSKRDLTLEEWIATGRAPATAGAGVQPASLQGVQPTAPQGAAQPTAPQTGNDLQEQGGVQSTAPQDATALGCNTAQPGVQPTADKPTTKPKVKTSSRPRRDLNAGRDDVERLCSHLADRIEVNGSLRPAVTKAWRDAARLMLDGDGRTEAQAHKAIDWCQGNEFWRKNVLSMPTLREKYDRLRMDADDERKRNTHSPNGQRPSTTDRRIAEIQALKGTPEDGPPASAISGSVIR